MSEETTVTPEEPAKEDFPYQHKGMSLMTAVTIQRRGDDIKVDFGGPVLTGPDTGKYVAWITLYNDGQYDRPLLNSRPMFDSPDEAIEHAKKIISDLRAFEPLKLPFFD